MEDQTNEIIERLQKRIEELEIREATRRTLRERLAGAAHAIRAKRSAIVRVMALAALCGTTFFLYAATINDVPDFTAGAPIMASGVNSNFHALYQNDVAINTEVNTLNTAWVVSGSDVSHTGTVGISGTLQAGNLLLKGPATIDIPGWSGPGWSIYHNADDGSDDYGLTFQRSSTIWLALGYTGGGANASFFSGKVAINKSLPLSYDLNVGGSAGGATSWQTSSSIRYKEDIRPLEGALDKVMQLQGVEFTWKSTKAPSIGFIAEEAGKVVPELVTYEENGKDAIGMDYGKMTVLLVEALKTQEKRIAELEAQVAALSIQQKER